jgi:hypothetical protein
MMAVTASPATAGSSRLVTSFTMSLTHGWDQIAGKDGGRPLAAGDLIMLEVRRPSAVAGPSGWTAAGGNRVFWKIIGPPGKEPPPAFYAAGAEEWEIQGYAIAGTEVTPFDDSGPAVERKP